MLAELYKQLADVARRSEFSIHGTREERDVRLKEYFAIAREIAKLTAYYQTMTTVVDTGVRLP